MPKKSIITLETEKSERKPKKIACNFFGFIFWGQLVLLSSKCKKIVFKSRSFKLRKTYWHSVVKERDNYQLHFQKFFSSNHLITNIISKYGQWTKIKKKIIFVCFKKPQKHSTNLQRQPQSSQWYRSGWIANNLDRPTMPPRDTFRA